MAGYKAPRIPGRCDDGAAYLLGLAAAATRCCARPSTPLGLHVGCAVISIVLMVCVVLVTRGIRVGGNCADRCAKKQRGGQGGEAGERERGLALAAHTHSRRRRRAYMQTERRTASGTPTLPPFSLPGSRIGGVGITQLLLGERL